MKIFDDIIKRAQSLFIEIISRKNREHDASFFNWYNQAQGISAQKAWRRMWFLYNKERIYSLSAAAVIIIFLTTVLFYPGPNKNNSIILAEQISPAFEHVILKTSSGDMLIVDTLSKTHSLLKGAVIVEGELIYDNINDNSSKDTSIGVSGKDNKSQTEYNELYVPKGRTYSITLSDGSRVWLNSESSIKYPQKFGEKERRVFITGEVYFEIKPDRRKFYAENMGYTVNVLGTKFNINAYKENESITTTLVEGLVSVSVNDDTEFTIKPGQQLLMEKKSSAISVSDVDVSKYISWVNNTLKMERSTLEEIFKILQRRYDFEIFYSDDNTKRERYSGDIPLNENLNIILYQISKVSDIEFQIEGKLVVVRYKK